MYMENGSFFYIKPNNINAIHHNNIIKNSNNELKKLYKKELKTKTVFIEQ